MWRTSSPPVIVLSKSYCPYCVSVKRLLSDLGVSFKAIELDKEADGGDIQPALAQRTGQRTVPNVIIGGNHSLTPSFICSALFCPCCFVEGGLSDLIAETTAMHKEGRLLPLLTEAGALAKAA